ncbi:MAG: Holliday junction branch migration protein RuvA [Candidatus Saganbacteria bacterium]|nr:Holliday junction branch migration protein RuvA [Candidatus Saganbacteria bacterium]
MISHLSGVLEHIDTNYVVVDVAGVGYHVNMPPSAMNRLPKVGSQIKLFIYQAVRENDISLYGFDTKEARGLFVTLISVSGIGPKMGLALIASFPLDKLVTAITMGDIALLSSVSGVGKKTAERLVVELREKISKVYGLKALEGLPLSQVDSPVVQDVMSALIALGYNAKEAKSAIVSSGADFDKITSVEEGIKKVLSRLV